MPDEVRELTEGDCFVVAARLVLNDDEGELRLCHGEVMAETVPEGHTATPGEYHWHAWVEKTTYIVYKGTKYALVTCIDKANGNDGELPQGFYYNAGHVINVKRYDRREAMRMMLTFEHYGPWHEPQEATE